MVGDAIRKVGMGILRRTRYSKPLVTIVNRAPVDTILDFDNSATIERGCKFIGEISLEHDVVIGAGSHLEGEVRVGRGTYLVRNDELIGEISVGNFCAIARNVTVQARDHLMTRPSIQMRFYDNYLDSTLPHVTKGPTQIGSDVWIGTDVVILSGVEIGHGAIIGAGSIVTRDVDPYAVVAGVPAERKSWRFSETIRNQLLDIQWWEWSDEEISRNKKFFESNLENCDDIYRLVSD